MRKVTILLCLICNLLVWTGCTFIIPAGKVVVGSGVVTSREFALSDFKQIDASHSFQITVKQADNFNVTVQADGNVVPYLDVYTTGGMLVIGVKPSNLILKSATLKATVTMPTLSGITLSGASRAADPRFSIGGCVPSPS